MERCTDGLRGTSSHVWPWLAQLRPLLSSQSTVTTRVRKNTKINKVSCRLHSALPFSYRKQRYLLYSGPTISVYFLVSSFSNASTPLFPYDPSLFLASVLISPPVSCMPCLIDDVTSDRSAASFNLKISQCPMFVTVELPHNAPWTVFRFLCDLSSLKFYTPNASNSSLKVWLLHCSANLQKMHISVIYY